MRYWYDSDNLTWTSNDGYMIQLNSDNKCYDLYSPDGLYLARCLFDDLRNQIGDLDIKMYEYMFYKAERFITVIEESIIKALNKAVCTRDYSPRKYYTLDDLPDPDCTVKFKDNVSTCGNCKHLIFKRYDEKRGYCRLVRIHRNFSDPCIHEEENS